MPCLVLCHETELNAIFIRPACYNKDIKDLGMMSQTICSIASVNWKIKQTLFPTYLNAESSEGSCKQLIKLKRHKLSSFSMYFQ